MKKVLSLICFLLTLTMLSSGFAVSAVDNPPSATGDVLYSIDFSKVSSIPEGIEFGYPGNGASFGYVTTNPSFNVKLDTAQGMLTAGGANADSYLVFPKVNTDSYYCEAEIVITSTGGSVGLANNLYGSLNAPDAGLHWLAIYVGGTGAPYSIRKSVGLISDRVTAKLPSGFSNYQKGQTATIALASYGGMNYYYIEGQLIASCEQIAPNAHHGYDRVGFFSYGASYGVKKLTVKAIEPSSEKEKKVLTFTLHSDFHYKEDLYLNTIADLETILARANASNSAFIMSAGDFCNDFAGSPELIKTYHNYVMDNGTVLPAYNVYGNHELETAGNSMANVTATLTNDKNVVWGTSDGKFNANIGYYYFESKGFRIVCMDTQYSFNPTTQQWEHNYPASWGAPSGNTKKCSLGPTQLAWLENVLLDAANKDLPCIVVGHDGVSGLFATSSGDAAAVRKIFKKANNANPGTVLMCINGHYHSNNQGYNEGVFYLDMNTVHNTLWRSNAEYHYNDSHTFTTVVYDAYGNPVRTVEKRLNQLEMGHNTWFSADPLSAVVTISSDGVIKIEGAQSKWIYGVEPQNIPDSTGPYVASGTYWDCSTHGHYKSEGADKWSYNSKYHWKECWSTVCHALYDKEEHNFNLEVIDDKYFAGTASNGNKKYYKSCVCGFSGDEVFEVVTMKAPNSPVTTGDVNKDGIVDTTDYLKIKSHFIGSAPLEGEAFRAGDASKDGKIDATDYIRIKSHFLGNYNLDE